MPWKKANQDLIKLLEDAMRKYNADRKPMFGSPTFFINNNMFAGVHEDTVILRLSEADRQELSSQYSEVKPFTPMPGSVMKEYAALPESLCRNPEIFLDWLERSFRYAASLPKKEKKRAKGK